MIIVRLMGGLGNQMFQYATGRQLAEKHNTPLRLDLTAYLNMSDIDTSREYELSCFNITGQPASEAELKRMLPQDFTPSLAYKVMRKLKINQRLRPLGEPSKKFYDVVLRASDNTYLVGWWQNERYFRDIKDILISEFTPKELSKYSQNMASNIKGTNAVSVHVRRGDYVTNKYANKEHGLATLNYYKKAIKYLEGKQDDLKFFVFSDDLDWCKKNLPVGKNAVFVGGNLGKKSYEDIYLMQQCKHNIIANSSFSWWGAWLNAYPDKIVVAPKDWFKNKRSNEETEVVPESWVRL